jgi:phosphoribosylformylglycinamidine cyclo-ligase
VIPGEVLTEIIEGTQAFFNDLKEYGIQIHYLGGETADVGDVVRTIAVNGTITARWPKNKLITNQKIAAGDVIVGFASSGKATYEKEYNSGLGSNGLTSARHDVLSKYYADKYPETYETKLSKEVVYIGKQKVADPFPFTKGLDESAANHTVGKMLLSPTRTYAPLLKIILEQHFDAINGIIHCSGGGQTKCMKYLPKPLRIVKDNLLDVPPIFQMIQANSGSDNREMYQVFNMGHRLEIFTNETAAKEMIAIANQFNIEAKIVGRVEEGIKKELIIEGTFGRIVY